MMVTVFSPARTAPVQILDQLQKGFVGGHTPQIHLRFGVPAGAGFDVPVGDATFPAAVVGDLLLLLILNEPQAADRHPGLQDASLDHDVAAGIRVGEDRPLLVQLVDDHQVAPFR